MNSAAPTSRLWSNVAVAAVCATKRSDDPSSTRFVRSVESWAIPASPVAGRLVRGEQLCCPRDRRSADLLVMRRSNHNNNAMLHAAMMAASIHNGRENNGDSSSDASSAACLAKGTTHVTSAIGMPLPMVSIKGVMNQPSTADPVNW